LVRSLWPKERKNEVDGGYRKNPKSWHPGDPEGRGWGENMSRTRGKKSQRGGMLEKGKQDRRGKKGGGTATKRKKRRGKKDT